jgi:integrase
VVRHSRGCRSRQGGRCSCRPSFQAQVWSAREQKTIRKSFRELGEARAWRQQSQVAVRNGLLRSPSQTTLNDAAADWLEAAEAGLARTRSGENYKPSAIRAYGQALNHRALPHLGTKRLTSVTHLMLQDFADRLSAEGLSPSSVRNTLLPLRAIFRRAHSRGEVAINPTLKLALPAVRGCRDRIAAPTELGPLLDALEPADRAIYATALYAGLRAGELQALHWDDINFETNLLHVHRNWDRQHGFVSPKSRSGTRRVPITHTLRRELLSHRLQQGNGGKGFVFPSTRNPNKPFNPSSLKLHTKKAWQDAGLTPIGLHECRHSYAAYMIAAGINTKALSTYMGHSSITITLDRYGHLLPGNETQAAQLLENWLRSATAPLAQRL